MENEISVREGTDENVSEDINESAHVSLGQEVSYENQRIAQTEQSHDLI